MKYTVSYTYNGKKVIAVDHIADKSFARFIFNQLRHCKMENVVAIWYNENGEIVRTIK